MDSTMKRIFLLGGLFLILVLFAFWLKGRGDGRTEVSLWFVDPTRFKLVETTGMVEGEATVGNALALLFAGTKEQGLESLIPEGVTLLNSYTDDNTLLVDLSGNINNANWGQEGNWLMLMSIVYTASEVSGRDRVRILIDGKEQAFFANGVYLGDALKKDPSVLR